MWSRSGSTGTARSTIVSAVPSKRADPQPPRQQRGGAEHEPGQQSTRSNAAASTPSFASPSCFAVERETRDEQRDGEADARDRAAARRRRPSRRAGGHGRGSSVVTSQRCADDADRLADDVADHDAERDRRARTRRERKPPSDRDARVREREQRHDHVARPRMEALLQPLVRRDRGAEPELSRARELRRRLLAEEPEQFGCALEIATRGGRGERQQPHGEPDHDRIDTRLRERDPPAGPGAAQTDAALRRRDAP